MRDDLQNTQRKAGLYNEERSRAFATKTSEHRSAHRHAPHRNLWESTSLRDRIPVYPCRKATLRIGAMAGGSRGAMIYGRWWLCVMAASCFVTGIGCYFRPSLMDYSSHKEHKRENFYNSTCFKINFHNLYTLRRLSNLNYVNNLNY